MTVRAYLHRDEGRVLIYYPGLRVRADGEYFLLEELSYLVYGLSLRSQPAVGAASGIVLDFRDPLIARRVCEDLAHFEKAKIFQTRMGYMAAVGAAGREAGGGCESAGGDCPECFGSGLRGGLQVACSRGCRVLLAFLTALLCTACSPYAFGRASADARAGAPYYRGLHGGNDLRAPVKSYDYSTGPSWILGGSK